jgi:hypothetical protein
MLWEVEVKEEGDREVEKGDDKEGEEGLKEGIRWVLFQVAEVKQEK